MYAVSYAGLNAVLNWVKSMWKDNRKNILPKYEPHEEIKGLSNKDVGLIGVLVQMLAGRAGLGLYAC